MASTFTSLLRLVKQGVGDNNTTWGTVFNQQFADLIDTAIAGYTEVAIADADTTLTASNGASDQARSMMLNCTGALTAARNVIVPNSTKLYFVENSTTGGFSITVKTAAGTGISIPMGSSSAVACDGTNVISPLTELATGATVGGLAIGYLNIPQNSQSADYTLVLSDAGKHIYHPLADATVRTWTIPANSSVAYAIGTSVTFINDLGNTVNIAIGSPDTLMLAGSGSTGTRVLGLAGVATAVKVGTTSWIISGTGIA